MNKPFTRYVNKAALSDWFPGFWLVDFSCGHSGILQAPTHRSPVVGECLSCKAEVNEKPQLAKNAPLMLCQDCLHVRPYCESGHFGDYRCDCGGDFCGCNSCNDFAYCQGADFEKRQARDSVNEKPEPVPAPTSRPELRLFCLLGETGSSDSAKPVATMQPLPPRPRINGQWPSACRAPLVLRDTQARRPSAAVLARCERHRQTNAFRTAARTI